MCTPELQEKLKPARQALKDYDEAKVELQRKDKLADADDVKVDMKPKDYFPNAFEEDIGSNNSGVYELKALITHKGRASNFGHYVAWVRVGEDEDESNGGAKWAACDDDERRGLPRVGGGNTQIVRWRRLALRLRPPLWPEEDPETVERTWPDQ